MSQQLAREASVDFSVITLNLHHDKDDWPRRRTQILSTLRALQPDVIALQEVLQTPALPNQASDLAAALGCEVHFVSADAQHSVRRYGHAILTRQQVIDSGGTRLQPLDDVRVAACPCAQGWAHGRRPCHLPAFQRQRRRQPSATGRRPARLRAT